MVGSPRQWKVSAERAGTVSEVAMPELLVVRESLMLTVTSRVSSTPFTIRATTPVAVAPASRGP